MNRNKICVYLKYFFILSMFILGASLICGTLYATSNNLIEKMIAKMIAEKLALNKESQSLKYWIHPPAYIYRKFYMFNVTNANDVLNRGKKPILQECGPYTYREVMEKRNLTHLDQDRVSYVPVSTLYFEPSLSNGTENDYITFLNLLDMGIIAKSDRINPTVFIKKTINDLISGHKSQNLELVNLIKGIRREKFGLYSEKNGTGLFTYVADTGMSDIYRIGKLESWNGMKELNFWATNASNAINGSDGSKYPPNITPDQILSFYNPDMCRSINLEYYRENSVDGIKTLDFHLQKYIFSNNETLNPNYNGFCPNDDCPEGLQSLRECKEGLPMFVSLPHFLRADKKLLEAVTGLKPDTEKHDYIISIEPTTGTSLKTNIRIQLNFWLKKNKKFKALEKVKDVMLPLFWLELQIETHSHINEKMKDTNKKLILAKRFPLIGLAIGSALIWGAAVLFIFTRLNRPNKSKVMISTLSLEQSKNRRFDL